MCEPMTIMAGAGLATTLIGTGIGAVGEQNAAAQKAAQDQQNAQLAQQQASDVLARGAYQAGQIQQRASQMIAAQRTGYAASGVDENVGSAAAVQSGTRAMATLDAMQTRNNAARQALGYQYQATQEQKQAELDKEAGRQALAGSILGGLGTALDGGSKVYKSGFDAKLWGQPKFGGD